MKTYFVIVGLFLSGLFINHGTPFTGDGLRPAMPNSIMAGFMNCQPPPPLPQDLAIFVDTAEHGVIFVSFGSVLQASKMPEEKRKMMLNVFSKLKQKVIWKWETEMPDAPDNVLLSPWLPQTSLLAHHNVKLFVTHGGAGSFQETICHRKEFFRIINSKTSFLMTGHLWWASLSTVTSWSMSRRPSTPTLASLCPGGR